MRSVPCSSLLDRSVITCRPAAGAIVLAAFVAACGSGTTTDAAPDAAPDALGDVASEGQADVLDIVDARDATDVADAPDALDTVSADAPDVIDATHSDAADAAADITDVADVTDVTDVPADACGVGLTPCASRCVNLTTDYYNCGSCGHTCGATEACEAGACVGGFCYADGDCTGGRICDNRPLCGIVPTCPPPNVLCGCSCGARCTATSCGAGMMCSGSCCVPASCASGADCPSGDRCIGACQSAGHCVFPPP